jgi:uncharacterized membrane protein YfcA
LAAAAPMTLVDTLLLIGAGLIGGTISAVLGGAAIVTFPALLATGLSPVTAAACNLTAMVPCNFIAAVADHTQLPRWNRAFVVLLVVSSIGATAGAGLLLVTPERTFEFLVPLLLGLATGLFAFSARISAWLRVRAADIAAHDRHASGHTLAALVPVSFYGGYFGAGVGVMLLAVLSVGAGGDYRAANVIKNLVTSVNSVIAAVVFIVQGMVVWPQTLAMMSGAFVGGVLGSWLARSLPRELMRVLIVAVGVVLTVVFANRYWF